METTNNNTVGSIRVSVDVIRRIAQTAAAEIDGVACEGQNLISPGGMTRLKTPVTARISGGTAAIKLRLVVLEGYNAVAVSERVQKSVKSAVQNMTGFTDTRVDVEIADVKFKTET